MEERSFLHTALGSRKKENRKISQLIRRGQWKRTSKWERWGKRSQNNLDCSIHMMPRTRCRAAWSGHCQPWHIPHPLLASAQAEKPGQARVTQLCTGFLQKHSNFKMKNVR